MRVRVEAGEIRDEDQRLSCGAGDESGDFLALGPRPRQQAQTRSLCSELERDFAADAMAGPGDQREFVIEPRRHAS
jgi:hypothetical protein